MGVKDLWGILSPVQRHVRLEDLRGKTLAVDLSIWVVEVQGMKQLQGVNKPHLRNIFFRAHKLLQLGILPIFVLEGNPPPLKFETMMKRAYGLAYKSGSAPPKNMGRSHFKSKLKECAEMLQYMGVTCVQSVGEAEAFCALLNKHGLVDACVTEDGDAFLYGARTVYRNFTINDKDPSVEIYEMDDIELTLGLTQENLVAMGILLGCDFVPKGVPGVGREMCLKLLNSLPSVNILERMKQWRSLSPADIMNTRVKVKDVAHCDNCSHPGTLRDHNKNGCSLCGTSKECKLSQSEELCPCHWHAARTAVTNRSAEMSIYKKAMLDPAFPHPQVIKEFLSAKDKLPPGGWFWKQPVMFQMQKYASDKLEWEEKYTQEKMLPLLTLWTQRQILETGRTGALQPLRIVKCRVQKRIPVYEVEWHKPANDDTTEETHYTTIEEQDLFNNCFPQIKEEFTQRTEEEAARKGKSKKKKATAKDIKETTNKENEVPRQNTNIFTEDLDGYIPMSQLNIKEPITELGMSRTQTQKIVTDRTKHTNLDKYHSATVDEINRAMSTKMKITKDKAIKDAYGLHDTQSSKLSKGSKFNSQTEVLEVSSDEDDFLPVSQLASKTISNKNGAYDDTNGLQKYSNFVDAMLNSLENSAKQKETPVVSTSTTSSSESDSDDEFDSLPLSQRVMLNMKKGSKPKSKETKEAAKKMEQPKVIPTVEETNVKLTSDIGNCANRPAFTDWDDSVIEQDILLSVINSEKEIRSSQVAAPKRNFQSDETDCKSELRKMLENDVKQRAPHACVERNKETTLEKKIGATRNSNDKHSVLLNSEVCDGFHAQNYDASTEDGDFQVKPLKSQKSREAVAPSSSKNDKICEVDSGDVLEDNNLQVKPLKKEVVSSSSKDSSSKSNIKEKDIKTNTAHSKEDNDPTSDYDFKPPSCSQGVKVGKKIVKKKKVGPAGKKKKKHVNFDALHDDLDLLCMDSVLGDITTRNVEPHLVSDVRGVNNEKDIVNLSTSQSYGSTRSRQSAKPKIDASKKGRPSRLHELTFSDIEDEIISGAAEIFDEESEETMNAVSDSSNGHLKVQAPSYSSDAITGDSSKISSKSETALYPSKFVPHELSVWDQNQMGNFDLGLTLDATVLKKVEGTTLFTDSVINPSTLQQNKLGKTLQSTIFTDSCLLQGTNATTVLAGGTSDDTTMRYPEASEINETESTHCFNVESQSMNENTTLGSTRMENTVLGNTDNISVNTQVDVTVDYNRNKTINGTNLYDETNQATAFMSGINDYSSAPEIDTLITPNTTCVEAHSQENSVDLTNKSETFEGYKSNLHEDTSGLAGYNDFSSAPEVCTLDTPNSTCVDNFTTAEGKIIDSMNSLSLTVDQSIEQSSAEQSSAEPGDLTCLTQLVLADRQFEDTTCSDTTAADSDSFTTVKEVDPDKSSIFERLDTLESFQVEEITGNESTKFDYGEDHESFEKSIAENETVLQNHATDATARHCIIEETLPVTDYCSKSHFNSSNSNSVIELEDSLNNDSDFIPPSPVVLSQRLLTKLQGSQLRSLCTFSQSSQVSRKDSQQSNSNEKDMPFGATADDSDVVFVD